MKNFMCFLAGLGVALILGTIAEVLDHWVFGSGAGFLLGFIAVFTGGMFMAAYGDHR